MILIIVIITTIIVETTATRLGERRVAAGRDRMAFSENDLTRPVPAAAVRIFNSVFRRQPAAGLRGRLRSPRQIIIIAAGHWRRQSGRGSIRQYVWSFR